MKKRKTPNPPKRDPNTIDLLRNETDAERAKPAPRKTSPKKLETDPTRPDEKKSPRAKQTKG